MPSSARGADLASWWWNRAAFRKEIADAIVQLRDCEGNLTSAAGDVPAASSVAIPDESAVGIAGQTQQMLTAIAAAQSELSQIAGSRQAAEAELAADKQRITGEVAARIRAQAERDANQVLRARKRGHWVQKKTFQILAAAVFVGTLYLLIEH